MSSERAFCSSSFVMAQSVVRKESMVHILGWIMPEPLHMPPRCTSVPFTVKLTANCLFFVSVVMMARLALSAAASPSSSAVTS